MCSPGGSMIRHECSSKGEPGMVKHLGIVAGLAVSLVLADASHAGDRETQADSLGGTGVTLYEISERDTVEPGPSLVRVYRANATSPHPGFAGVRTPLS